MIVNNTYILTLPLYTTLIPLPHAVSTLTCILIWHTHTDATVYTTLKLPYSHIALHSMAHLSLNQYQMHPHHYARHLPLYPVLFTHKSHDCPHFNIYISFGDSKYCILYNCTKYMSYITFTLYFTSFLLHLCKLCITIIAKIA